MEEEGGMSRNRLARRGLRPAAVREARPDALAVGPRAGFLPPMQPSSLGKLIGAVILILVLVIAASQATYVARAACW